MLAYLKPVLVFAEGWHLPGWSMAVLAPALTAELAYLPGRGILGASGTLDGARQIVVNERYRGLPIGDAVIGHEGGHFLTRAQGAYAPFCSPRSAPMAAEIPAWQACALLAVSAIQATAYGLGEASLADLVAANHLPGELIDLGLALRRPGSLGHGTALGLWFYAMGLELARLR